METTRQHLCPRDDRARAPAMSHKLRLVVLMVGGAVAYWDGGKGTADPYAQAKEASRRAQMDPDILKKDPDYFKRMFGKMAVEQGQAKAVDAHQNVSPQDICVACHGVVIEIEKILKARVDKQRNSIAVTEVLEAVCHLDRYEFQDPVKVNVRTETSRDYGGLAPPVMANACKRVVDAWQDDDDEIEGALKKVRGCRRRCAHTRPAPCGHARCERRRVRPLPHRLIARPTVCARAARTRAGRPMACTGSCASRSADGNAAARARSPSLSRARS
eukprot:5014159-Prymnesium_polylepis.1